MPTRPAARLLPAAPTGLPGWCDRFLADPVAGEFFASRAWYDTLLAGALPAGTQPVLALVGEAALLPLLRQGGRLGGRLAALVSPYTLDWRPLAAPGADAAVLRAAGAALGRRLRRRPPTRLDTLDPEAPGLVPLLEGLSAAGLRPLRFLHTGNWHEALAPGTGWEDYLAGRPPALRNTIARKLRAARGAGLDWLAAPGRALEEGIAAYADVRARSWKPDEPFPEFDAALMRVAAGLGVLRLGVLRDAAGRAMAAQYWILDRGGRRATVLKLAHAEDSRAASPGTVLTARMIRRLLEEGTAELDFGRGDDDYKRLWVGARRQRIGLLLADPMHPAGLLALARQAAGALRRRLRPAAGEVLPG
ncbi:GNAT family N-acetyltransferase [Paracraurococcus lichenis]|uniref:GNAT family N-acetyltransferase n=1 Tax=Paracraurococcus lichenis TaxID=3064888 RepID=A0ABT9E300_9PROT|nr:GNAT family N-acetyltransferase [Paracraurococcus sp. LOR1-02]MDO9710539.1 GNAT family N-acetyltransferase [Paracraurococcus sp. LOR1-02]